MYIYDRLKTKYICTTWKHNTKIYNKKMNHKICE